MRRFDGRRRDTDDEEAGGNSVIRPSGQCGVIGCGRKAFIALAQGTTPHAARVTVLASEMVTPAWRLRTGWTLYGWLERCGSHFSEEMLRYLGEPIGWHQEEFRHIRSREAFIEACHGMPYADWVAAKTAKAA